MAPVRPLANNVWLHWSCWITHVHFKFGNVFSNNAPCSDDRTFTDSQPWEEDGSSSDTYTTLHHSFLPILSFRWRILVVGECNPRPDKTVGLNGYSFWNVGEGLNLHAIPNYYIISNPYIGMDDATAANLALPNI